MTAYVNLPADSVGFMGWFRGSKERVDIEREPITFHVREREETFNVNHLSSTMVLELQLELFNMSDVAYSIKSDKSSKVMKSMEYIQDLGYQIEHVYMHKSNHTLLLILGRLDRIVIVFRGTTDVEHWKTDMNLRMTSIEKVLLSTGMNHPIQKSRDWRNAMTHKGFSDAYKSVSEPILEKVSAMMNESPRPIYFTGHSLGGALASLCSVDIAISLGTTDLFVCTIGSPKVGNYYFQRLYNEIVPAHWRIAMRSDIITTLPRMGYHHVGKRVALTSSGEIFLDPNAIETMLWSSAGLSISDHRKPAYKEALTLFCSKYVPNYIPTFVDNPPSTKENPSSLSDPTTLGTAPISIISIDDIPTMILE